MNDIINYICSKLLIIDKNDACIRKQRYINITNAWLWSLCGFEIFILFKQLSFQNDQLLTLENSIEELKNKKGE